MASGMYSTPFTLFPEIENIDAFRADGGITVHSSDFAADSEMFSGRQDLKCTVVGGGKSAYDIALNVLNYPDTFDTKQVEIIQRRPDYPVPRFIAGLIPFQYLLYNQLGYSTFFPGCSFDAAHSKIMKNKVAQWLLLNVYWKLVAKIWKIQFKLKGTEVPKDHVLQSLFKGGTILDTPTVNRAKQSGQMVTVPNESIVRYDAESKRFVLASGTAMERATDVLCSATGFKKSYSWFDAETLNALGFEDDGLYLYNQILPIQVERLAFVGSEVSSFQNVVTHFVQSEWLGHHLDRETELDPERMTSQVEDHKRSKRDWLRFSPYRASNVQPHVVGYNNHLCRDMDAPQYEKKGLLRRWLEPYSAEDYARILDAKT